MDITQIVNALMKLHKEALALSRNDYYKASFREAHKEEADLLRGSAEELIEHFELKICQSCDQAFLPEQDEKYCAGCGEHIANRYAMQEYLDNDRVRGF